jgi:hypothetical protein
MPIKEKSDARFLQRSWAFIALIWSYGVSFVGDLGTAISDGQDPRQCGGVRDTQTEDISIYCTEEFPLS